jgi:hypothetical protein
LWTTILYSKNGCYVRTVFTEYWELMLQKSAVESVGCFLSQGTQMIAQLAACWLIWKQKQKFIKILSHVCAPLTALSLSLLQLVTRGNYNSFMDLQTLQKKVKKSLYDRQSVGLRLGVRHPSGTHDQFFFLEIFFRELRVCNFVYRSLLQTLRLLCPHQVLLGNASHQWVILYFHPQFTPYHVTTNSQPPNHDWFTTNLTVVPPSGC